MKDLHEVFTTFKKEFPDIYGGHEALGKKIHERAGALPEKTRWLIKVAVSGASGHTIALETHITKARKARRLGRRDQAHAPPRYTDGRIPDFMEAYSTYKKMK